MSSSSESARIRAEDLLTHAAWASRLANKLVRDAAAADDLVQDTWLAALRRPPLGDRPLRPWLAGVMHNLARMRWRGEARRDRRERIAAESTRRVPSPDELAERLDWHRILTELVGGLEEPFRSTVLLRYYEGLSAAAIARQQDVPAGTVRWRLKRGLDELRARLDERTGGDRRAWSLALIPLATSKAALATAASLFLGVFAMGTVFKLLAGAGVVLLVFLGLQVTGTLPAWLGGERDFDAPERVSFRPLDAPEPVPGEQPGETPVLDRSGNERAGAPAGNPARVIGRLVATEGGAVARASLVIEGTSGRVEAKSAADGRFDFPVDLPDERWQLDLVVRGHGRAFRRLEFSATRGETTHLGDVLLAPGGNLRGRVVDPAGKPVPGASVAVSEVDDEPTERRRRGMRDGLFFHAWPGARADEDGRFLLEGVEAGLHRIWAGAKGYLADASGPVEVRAGMESNGLAITLRALSPEDTIEVRVIDPDGQPVPHADIRYEVETGGLFGGRGSGNTAADGNGTHRFVVGPKDVYRIRARDREDKWGEAVAEEVRGGSGVLTLQLAEARLATVEVRDANGQPVREFSVSVVDPENRSLNDYYAAEDRADGRLSIRVPAVPFRLRVIAEGFDEGDSGTLEPDAAEAYRVTLTALPGIRGIVRSGDKPLAAARVSIHPVVPTGEREIHNGFLTRYSAGPAAQGRTGEDGRFHLTLRRKGRFVIRAEAEGLAPAEIGPIDLDPKRGRSDVEFSLTEGGALTGRVGLSGREPGGLIVGISRADGFARTRRVGAEGVYRFEHLMPGEWLVRLVAEEIVDGNSSTTTSPGLAKPEFNCRVEEGQETTFDLIEASGEQPTLSGSLQIPGVDLLGYVAMLMPPDQRMSSGDAPKCALDAKGRFKITAPRPGRYRLLVDAPRSAIIISDFVDLAAGGHEWSLVLELAPLSGTSEGAALCAYLWEGEKDLLVLAPVKVSEEGAFSIAGVPVGRGRIVKIDPTETILDPREWEQVQEVEVLPETGAEVRIAAE